MNSQLYVYMDPFTGEISLSAYDMDDSLFENNHIVLTEMRGGKPNRHRSVLNVLANVLAQANIKLIEE
jgi:hypothetical protein